MTDKYEKLHYTTDSLALLAHSDKMTPEEKESMAQQFLDSIEAFRSLRLEPPQKAGEIILINIDRAVREHKARPKTEASTITCRQGCGHCCLMPVMATIPEAVVALDYAERQGIVIDEAKLARQARYPDAVWFDQPAADLPCVFLTADQSCGIYAARPASCRKHFSCGPPEECDVKRQGTGFLMKRWVAPLAEILYSAIMNVFRPGPFPKVLLIALAKRSKGGTA